MIVTLKTLQQKTFKIEIDESETVLDLKAQIEAEQGSNFPAASLKLIYAGKILNDATVLSEYKIQESNFMVVMVSKTKALPPKTQAEAPPPQQQQQQQASTTTAGESSATPQQTTTSPSESSQPQAQPEQVTDTPQPSGEETPPTAAVSAPAESEPMVTGSDPAEAVDTSASAASTSLMQQSTEELLTSGPEFEAAVVNLIDMGFEREHVVRCMRASFNNPDRAAEYLMNGIPDTVQQLQQQQPPPPQGSGQAAGSSQHALESLRNQPQFAQLRALLQHNPAMLPSVMQGMQQSNPELLQLISQNQEAFINLLNAPAEEAGAGGGGGGGEGEAGGALGPEPMTIQVTAEEKAVIDKIKAMGFPEHMVVQAFFACEKNEEKTVNFLLEDRADDY